MRSQELSQVDTASGLRGLFAAKLTSVLVMCLESRWLMQARRLLGHHRVHRTHPSSRGEPGLGDLCLGSVQAQVPRWRYLLDWWSCETGDF